MKNQDEINNLRTQIDNVDDQINDLLAKRAALAVEVKKVKNGSQVFRPNREAEIIARATKTHTGPLSNEAVAAVFTEIIGACRNLEQTLRVAYLGPIGTYSYEMARKEFGSTSEFVAELTLKSAFEAVELGRAEICVIPIENSSEGPVVEAQKLLHDTELHVIRETTLPISHNLLSKAPLDSIKTIYAHPQSLGQCRFWLQSHVPDAALVTTTSNSEAAKMAATQKNTAAIAGLVAAEIYDVPILVAGINDESGGKTRFFTLSRDQADATGDDKTGVIVTLKDKPGSLYSLLGEFVKYKIDLTNLKSQPTTRGLHTFFIEFIGHVSEKYVASALADIQAHADECKVIGSYPRERTE